LKLVFSRPAVQTSLHLVTVKIDSITLMEKCQEITAKSRYCPLCITRCASGERRHLKRPLPELLATHPRVEAWLVTADCGDSAEISDHAKAAVDGVKRLMRYPQF
jgi:hypothetical protein